MTSRRALLRVAIAAGAAIVAGAAAAACGTTGGAPAADGYRIDDAPGYPIFDHTLTWTGSDLLVIGGAGGDTSDGRLVDEPLIWNPSAGVRAVTAPPGPPRNRHTAVWAGDELIVWSGTTEPYGVGDGLLADTLAYDPATDTWRELADGPVRAARVRGRGTTFAGYAIVTGGSTPDPDDEGTIGLYHLDSDTWSLTEVPGDALTAVATGNGAYVLWVDGRRTVRFSSLDPETGDLADIALPDLPEGADRSNAVAADGRLVVWAEAFPSDQESTDDSVAAYVLDDDAGIAAGPAGRADTADTADAADAVDGAERAAWRELPVEVEFPGSVTGFNEVRPLVHTDEWLAFLEGAEMKWIRIDDGLEVRRTLSTPQSCALNTEAVGTPAFVVAWGGNCSRINDDGSEEQIVEHFVFEPPEPESGTAAGQRP